MTHTQNLERESADPVEREGADRVEPANAKTVSLRHSVNGARLLVGAMAMALLMPLLISIGDGAGNDQNRRPVPFPRPDSSNMFDTATYRQFDEALRDRLSIRRWVVAAMGIAGYEALRSSLNSQVYVGEDGIPFLTDDFLKPCRTSFDAIEVDARLRSWERLARQSGKDVLFAIAPDKSTVMRGKLGWRADALMVCADPPREQSQMVWGGDSTGPVVTLWPQFEAVEKAEPGRLFQRGDSHWSYQGSMIFTRAVIDRLVARGEAPERLRGAPGAVQDRDRRRQGDLYRLMGFSQTDMVANWVVRREGVTVATSTISTPSGRGIRTHTAVAPAGTPLIAGRTLVVYDSFFHNAEAQMAPYFEQMTAVHWDDFLPMARKGNVPGFDRVIFESVQRGWPQRTVDQLPEPSITAAITRELSKPAQPTASG